MRSIFSPHHFWGTANLNLNLNVNLNVNRNFNFRIFCYVNKSLETSILTQKLTKWHHNHTETSPKGFSASKCDEGNGILSKSSGYFWEYFGKFLGGFFWRNFFGGIFREIFERNFFGRIFFGGFFWRIFCEEFFERNSLVEIEKELMFLSRFRKEGKS